MFKINYAISAVTTAMGLPVKRQGVLLICLCSSGRPEYQAGVRNGSVLWRGADQMW